MAGISNYIEACKFRKNFINEQLQWLREEDGKFATDIKRLQDVEQRIRQELIGYLLPEVQDPHLDSLEERLSYSGLRPIKRKYDEAFDAAEKRRVELEAMDEFQHYDFLIDQANQGVEDIRPKYETACQHISLWEGSKWFKQLNQRKYFEQGYVARWWHTFFDWRAISFLMSELSKKAKLKFNNPVSLKQHYRQLRDETNDIVAAYDKRVAERDRIHGIKTEHQELLKAPERLLAELFNELGGAAISHLDACPEDLRIDLARGDKVLNAFLRKQTGVRKQIQYLRELSVTRLKALFQQLKQDLAKTEAKIKKLELQKRRGKRKHYYSTDLQRMRNVKTDKWERRRDKTGRLRNKIAGFEKYDRGSFTSDYLWWDLITGGSAADDIFEVRDFRNRNPEWDRSSYRDPTEDHATTETTETTGYDDAAEDLAASMLDSHEDHLFVDPS